MLPAIFLAFQLQFIQTDIFVYKLCSSDDRESELFLWSYHKSQGWKVYMHGGLFPFEMAIYMKAKKIRKVDRSLNWCLSKFNLLHFFLFPLFFLQSPLTFGWVHLVYFPIL